MIERTCPKNATGLRAGNRGFLTLNHSADDTCMQSSCLWTLGCWPLSDPVGEPSLEHMCISVSWVRNCRNTERIMCKYACMYVSVLWGFCGPGNPGYQIIEYVPRIIMSYHSRRLVRGRKKICRSAGGPRLWAARIATSRIP